MRTSPPALATIRRSDRTMRSLPLLSSLLLAAMLSAQDPTTLHLSLPSQPQFFRHSLARTQTTELRGQELVFETRVEHTLRLAATKVEADGVTVAELEVLRTKGAMSFPGSIGEVEFDSASAAEPDEQGIGTVMCAFAGHRYSVRIARNGDVLGVKGAAEVLAAVAKDAEGMGKQLLAAQVTETTLQNIAQALVGRLPDAAVAVGGSWTRQSKDELRGTPMLTETKMTLGKRSGARFEVAIEGKITTPDAKEGAMRLTKGAIAGDEVLTSGGGVEKSTRKVSTTSEGPSPVGEGSIVVVSEVEVTVAQIPEAEAKVPAKGEAKGEDEAGKDPHGR
jgi:hypothetical protein